LQQHVRLCLLSLTDTSAILADIRTYASGDGLTTEEYLMWTVNNPLPVDFLNLLFQVSLCSNCMEQSRS